MGRKSLPILLIFAAGVAFFILYTFFFQDPAPEFKPMPGFAGYREKILALNPSDYQIVDVIDEGFVVRVNVVLNEPEDDRTGIRTQATNALYDMQSAVGKEISVSVWAYRSAEAIKSNLAGMVFYHALTEQQVFKSPEELP